MCLIKDKRTLDWIEIELAVGAWYFLLKVSIIRGKIINDGIRLRTDMDTWIVISRFRDHLKL